MSEPEDELGVRTIETPHHCWKDARVKELHGALRWLTNICCGVGKSGLPTTSEEGDTAIANAQRVLASEGAEDG